MTARKGTCPHCRRKDVILDPTGLLTAHVAPGTPVLAGRQPEACAGSWAPSLRDAQGGAGQ